MANAGAHGYYRSGYSSDAIRAIGRSLEHELTPSERIVLLGDAWASVRVGEQQIGDYLALAEGARSDRTRAVLSQVTAKLEYISNYLVSDVDRKEYEQWVRRLLTPVAAELGWQPKAGESDETKSLRARVLHTLGYAGRDPDTIAKARQLTERALQDPASIDSTVAFTAFSLAAENGDAILYDKVMAKLQSRGSSLESYYLYFQTLSKFHDPKLLRRTLDYAVSPAVRSQDMLGMIAAVMRNPAGAKLAWDFVRMHWPEIEKVGGGFTSAEVVAATGVFCDTEMHDQVRNFFVQHDVPTAERTLKLSLESIHNCTDLKSQQTPELSTWLQQKGSASGK
jgi:aminopeptidase N